jgi:hypothetical protein
VPVFAARRRPAAAGSLVLAAVLGLTLVVAPVSARGFTAARSHPKHPAGYGSATCPAVYPLSQVHAGLRGTGYTTVKGRTPKPFAVKVLGVLKDGIAPGVDMILISTHSAATKRNGTWEGMSGSPIYASDGRLIGALSYGISFGATNKAGVTPAGAMYQLLDDPRATPPTYANHVAIPSQLRDSDASRDAASAADLQLLRTPITVVGLPSSRWSELRTRLHQAGWQAFSLHAGSARGVQRRGSAASIRPGAPFAVTIASGAYTIGGVGTVTAVCAHKVLAFGHPMALSGATNETANAARVLYVQRDPAGSSFVMANIGHLVGTLDQDRLPGIRATLGRIPTRTTITTHSTAPGTGLHRTGVTRTPLVEEVADATGGSTYYGLIATTQHEGAGSATFTWTATGRRDDGTRWTFHRTDQYTDPFDVEFGTSFQLFQTLATIVDNPFDAVTVTKVTVHAQATEAVKEWELRGLSANDGDGWQDVTPSTTLDVAPGDNLELKASLAAYRNSHKTKTVKLTVHIPQDASSGSGTIQVAGGADLAAAGPDLSAVTSFSQMMKVLNAVPHGNDLVAQLSVPSPDGTTTLIRNHHARLTQVTRGLLTLAINVDVPCDCDGEGGDGGGDGDVPPDA